MAEGNPAMNPLAWITRLFRSGTIRRWPEWPARLSTGLDRATERRIRQAIEAQLRRRPARRSP
jgi:hypothetical protein